MGMTEEIGVKGQKIASGMVGKSFMTKDGIKIWTGRTIEPYFRILFDFGPFIMVLWTNLIKMSSRRRKKISLQMQKLVL